MGNHQTLTDFLLPDWDSSARPPARAGGGRHRTRHALRAGHRRDAGGQDHQRFIDNVLASPQGAHRRSSSASTAFIRRRRHLGGGAGLACWRPAAGTGRRRRSLAFLDQAQDRLARRMGNVPDRFFWPCHRPRGEAPPPEERGAGRDTIVKGPTAVSMTRRRPQRQLFRQRALARPISPPAPQLPSAPSLIPVPSPVRRASSAYRRASRRLMGRPKAGFIDYSPLGPGADDPGPRPPRNCQRRGAPGRANSLLRQRTEASKSIWPKYHHPRGARRRGSCSWSAAAHHRRERHPAARSATRRNKIIKFEGLLPRPRRRCWSEAGSGLAFGPRPAPACRPVMQHRWCSILQQPGAAGRGLCPAWAQRWPA